MTHLYSKYDLPHLIDGKSDHAISDVIVNSDLVVNKIKYNFFEVSIIVSKNMDLDDVTQKLIDSGYNYRVWHVLGNPTNIIIHFRRRSLRACMRFINKYVQPIVPSGTICFIGNICMFSTKNGNKYYHVMYVTK